MQYFRRALKLNRNYLSAWTLMGHEYVEMKNPPAAIGTSSPLSIFFKLPPVSGPLCKPAAYTGRGSMAQW